MKPGRELDVLIAEKVFGVKVDFLNQKAGWRIDYTSEDRSVCDPIYGMDHVHGYRIKRYSVDIKAVWEIIDKLVKDPENTIVEIDVHTCEEETSATIYTTECDKIHSGFCKTAPHAICLAALKAIGVDT